MAGRESASLYSKVVRYCRAVFYLAVPGTTATAWAQDVRPVPAPSMPPVGRPHDWGSRQVIYTAKGSLEDVWKLRDDPRFLNSVIGSYMNARRDLAGNLAFTNH